ncbi:MAG: cell division protein FtsQ/DivIB [Candidatus Marinimicrobia bacterium]|nr:cell division protein FtsQ/DivIB [Candidatus Neomarinimicrobiota bacterium]
MNFKNKKKKKIKYTVFFTGTILILSSIAYLSYKWCTFRQIFRIDKIDITGCYIITEQDIMNKIQKLVKDKSLKQINCQKIQNSIQEMQFVKASNVIKRFPAKLQIQIIERIPLCYLINSDNNYLLDAKGTLLPIPDNSLNSNLPLITGYQLAESVDYGEQISSQKLKNSVALFADLKSQVPEAFNIISELNYNTNSEQYMLYLNTNTKIYLGTNDIKQRLNVLIHFLKQIPDNIEIGRYEYLDMRWKDQIVVKPKNI